MVPEQTRDNKRVYVVCWWPERRYAMHGYHLSRTELANKLERFKGGQCKIRTVNGEIYIGQVHSFYISPGLSGFLIREMRIVFDWVYKLGKGCNADFEETDHWHPVSLQTGYVMIVHYMIWYEQYRKKRIKLKENLGNHGEVSWFSLPDDPTNIKLDTFKQN